MGRYSIWQIADVANAGYAFRDFTETAHKLAFGDYKRVYEGDLKGLGGDFLPNPISAAAIAETVMWRHNRDDRPSGDTMRSMSTSDILVIEQENKTDVVYVDTIGFVNLKSDLPDLAQEFVLHGNDPLWNLATGEELDQANIRINTYEINNGDLVVFADDGVEAVLFTWNEALGESDFWECVDILAAGDLSDAANWQGRGETLYGKAARDENVDLIKAVDRNDGGVRFADQRERKTKTDSPASLTEAAKDAREVSAEQECSECEISEQYRGCRD